MSEFGLTRQLGISREEARSRIETYFDRYPQVREFMDEMRVASEQDRFVRTLFGQRVYSPRAVGHQARQAAQHAAQRSDPGFGRGHHQAGDGRD